MEQIGTVLVFTPGTTAEEARSALETLKKILQSPPQVRSFNPEHGGPVWYIP